MSITDMLNRGGESSITGPDLIRGHLGEGGYDPEASPLLLRAGIRVTLIYDDDL